MWPERGAWQCQVHGDVKRLLLFPPSMATSAYLCSLAQWVLIFHQ